jgi:hypothetical protein
VRPPRVTFALPARIGRRAIGPGRYRVTLLRLQGRRARAIASTVARVR